MSAARLKGSDCFAGPLDTETFPLAALSPDAERVDKFIQTRDRLSLGQLMILIAGAAVGLGLLPLGSLSHLPVYGRTGISWQGLVIALYGTVSGATMAAFCQQQPECDPLSQSQLSHSAISGSRSVALSTHFLGVFSGISLTTPCGVLESLCLGL